MKNPPGPSTRVPDAAITADSREASSMGVPGPRLATPWIRLVGAIDLSKDHQDDLSHPDDRLDDQKQQIGVRVSRVAKTPTSPGYWVKEIHPLHSRLAGINAWETEILNYLGNKWDATPAVGELPLKGHVVRIHSLEKKLAFVGTEFGPSSIYSQTLAHETVVKTLHAGVTVDRLLACAGCSDGAPPELIDGRLLASALAPPGNLLRLVRKVLAALQALASVHVVHGDVSFRNMAVWCSKPELLSGARGEAYRFRLDWNKVRLIDFGFSCHDRLNPKVFLLRNPEHPSISARFRRLTALICHTKDSKLLGRYRDIDWREDLYQLGYELRQWLCRSTLNRASTAPAQEAISRMLWGEHASPRPSLRQPD